MWGCVFLPGLKTGFVMVKFAQGAFAALILIVVNGFANAQTAMIDRSCQRLRLWRFKVLLFLFMMRHYMHRRVITEIWSACARVELPF